MPGIGHTSKAAFKIETGAFGTPISLNGGGEYNQIHFLSEGFNPATEFQNSMALEGNAGYKTMYPVLKKYEGELTIECWYRGMEALFAIAFGRSHQNNSPIDQGSGAYEHCFELSEDMGTRAFDIFDMNTPSGNAIRRGTLGFEKDTSVWEFASTMFNSIAFSATPERVTLTLNGAAYSLGNDTATNPASSSWAVPPTENQILFTDMSVYLKPRDMFTITSANDTGGFEDGGGSSTFHIADGTYTGWELAQLIESALNANATLSGTYKITYNEIKRSFRIECDEAFGIDSGGTIDIHDTLGWVQSSIGSGLLVQESTYPAVADQITAFASGDKLGVNAFNWSLENNLKMDDQDSESGGSIKEPERNGFRRVTGTIEVPRYTDDEFIKSLNGFTTYEMWVVFSGATIGGGNAEELNFYFPQIKFTNVGAPVSGPELIKQSLSFEAQTPLRWYNFVDFLNNNYNWKDLRAVTTDLANCFGMYSDGLYCGGSSAGAASIFKLSESDWTWSSSTDTTQNVIHCLQMYGGKLFAGCDAGVILEYNGTTWSTSTDVGAGDILDMIVYGNNLYAIEDSTGKVFSYNGTSWSTSTDSTLTNATKMETYNGNLYVAGDDGTDGFVLQYNGSAWSTSCDFGVGTINWMGLVKHNGKLYASTNVGGTDKLWEFNGSAWTNLATIADEMKHLVSYRGNLLMIPYGASKDVYYFDFSSNTDVNLNSGLNRTFGMKPREYRGRLLIPEGTTSALILDPMQEIFATTQNQNSLNPL